MQKDNNYRLKSNIPLLVHIVDPVIQVECGFEHTYCITEQNVYAWGANTGIQNISFTPTIVPIISGQVDRISSGKDHAFAWNTQNGNVYVWGSNNNGKLGMNIFNQHPVLFDIFTEASKYGWKLLKLVAGLEHSVALVEVEDLHKLFVWGSNGFQQLGFDASEKHVAIPHQLELESLQKLKDIYAKHNYTMAITQEGNVYSWGSNEFGRLGQQGFAKYTKLPQPITALKEITKLGLGVYHVLALDEQGRVFSWGRGLQGQLGQGSTSDQLEPRQISKLPLIVDVNCGESHSLLLSAKGDVLAFGSGSHGQLGLGDYKQYDTPTQIANLENIIQIRCGKCHSATLSASGQLFTFGSNESGQLGVNQKRSGSVNFSTPLLERRDSESISNRQTSQNKIGLKKMNEIMSMQELQSDQQSEVFEQTDSFMNKLEQIVTIENMPYIDQELKDYQSSMDSIDIQTSKFMSDVMERIVKLIKFVKKQQ